MALRTEYSVVVLMNTSEERVSEFSVYAPDEGAMKAGITLINLSASSKWFSKVGELGVMDGYLTCKAAERFALRILEACAATKVKARELGVKVES